MLEKSGYPVFKKLGGYVHEDKKKDGHIFPFY